MSSNSKRVAAALSTVEVFRQQARQMDNASYRPALLSWSASSPDFTGTAPGAGCTTDESGEGSHSPTR
jgi:hypothetical protein